jgi:hypothetical protein
LLAFGRLAPARNDKSGISNIIHTAPLSLERMKALGSRSASGDKDTSSG